MALIPRPLLPTLGEGEEVRCIVERGATSECDLHKIMGPATMAVHDFGGLG